MASVLRGGFLYFAIAFAAGFVLGTLRILVLAPLIGELAAVALELPVMLLVSWFACGGLVRQFSVPALAFPRLAMGALAFGLLMLAEIALSVLAFGRSGAEYLALLQTPSGLLGLSGQIAFAFIPLWQLGQARLK